MSGGVLVRCGKPPYSIAGQPLIDEASSYAAFVCAAACAGLGVVSNVVGAAVLVSNRYENEEKCNSMRVI